MLRLAEIESKELKDSLRYVEIQLAKTKENLRATSQQYSESQAEVQSCHEMISRQANINHAQAQQIEELSKQVAEAGARQNEAAEKWKLKLAQYQNEVDLREADNQKVKRLLENRDNEVTHLNTQLNIALERTKDIEDELEMKDGENNRLRRQCADTESAMQDLYKSRKGPGSLTIEIDSLKADNERLISLLRRTSEYSDFDDAQIVKAANSLTMKGVAGVQDSLAANRRTRGVSADACKPKGGKSNDWIPTEAVRAVLKIKDHFEGKMTETAVSQILYELNTIWRNLMRAETDAIKRRMGAQIQDLRRQVVTKQAFDKGELLAEITRTKKQLSFTSKQLQTKKRPQAAPGKENTRGSSDQAGVEELERSIRMVETIGIQKRALEGENEELRSRIEVLEHSRIDQHQSANQAAQRHGLMPMAYGSNQSSEFAL